MAISKDKKKELIDQYVSDLKAAQNVVIVQQSGISVNTSSDVRKQVLGTEGKFNVVRKRLFLRALAAAGYETVDIEKLEGPIGVLYATSDEYGPLKVVNKFAKGFVKDKSDSSFKFLGAWYDKKWYDSAYVTELANVPSKEELISKLAYLFNYPLQSFACVVNEVAKKQAA
ncbi:MAG: 50S ribosomal protein L10 [Candidatus Peribacteria bacterium]|jgi:large subunit ribosomal protein L10|nr:50S ribosomal protein L10 [Candidatus Peribacteria bacterium]